MRSRAIVPADGYYEWLTVGKTKTPYYVTDPVEGELAFAGLYSWWRAPLSAAPEPSARRRASKHRACVRRASR